MARSAEALEKSFDELWNKGVVRVVRWVDHAARIGGGRITLLAVLVPAASYAALGLITNIALALGSLFLTAIATSLNQIVVSTPRQVAVPDALLARVTAAYRLIVLGVVPLGAVSADCSGNDLGSRSRTRPLPSDSSSQQSC